MKQFDPKYAPKNIARAASVDTGKAALHQKEVVTRLTERARLQGEDFLQEAVTYTEEWRDQYPESYLKDDPKEIALAAIMAVSIRRSMRRKEEEYGPSSLAESA